MLVSEKALLDRACINLDFEEKYGLLGRKEFKILILKLYNYFKKIDNPKIKQKNIILDASKELFLSVGTAQNYFYRDLGVHLPNIFGIIIQKSSLKDEINVSFFSTYYKRRQERVIKSPEIFNLLSSKAPVKVINNRIIGGFILSKRLQKALIGSLLY